MSSSSLNRDTCLGWNSFEWRENSPSCWEGKSTSIPRHSWVPLSVSRRWRRQRFNMSRHDPMVRLRHMLSHAREAVSITQGKVRADLNSDRQLNLALVRLLEIVGEAAAP